MTDTHDHSTPPDFAERLMRLAGESTYRMPVESRSTASRPIPAPHLLAAALAFARDGDDDIGPDVAYDITVQRTGHAARVTRLLAEAIGRDRRRLVERNRPVLRQAAWAGYTWAVHGGPFPMALKPGETSTDDWLVLVEAARRILWTLADEAVLRAERAYRRRAAA